MNEQVTRLFERRNIDMSELQYLIHSAKRTVLYLRDGREVSTSLPLKDIFADLPGEDFWNIQKGIVVAARYVLNVDENGVYTMVDGKQFQGRQRSLAEHKRRRRELELGPAAQRKAFPLTLTEKCSLMENAPIAFCIIELVFSPDGHGMDFIFRYCNKEMEDVEGVPVSEMINRSFYAVFPDGDRKWIIPYADVALNGTRRVLRDYSPEIGKHLIIRCFQPAPGYCACFLMTDDGAETE